MKRIVVLIMTVVLCVSSLTGCGIFGKHSEKEAVSDVLLYDFEEYDRNFQLMRVMQYFGAVNVNKEAQYVKSGSTSALLQPLGYHSTMIGNTYTGLKAESCLYIPFTSELFAFDYSDSTKIRDISFSIYNAESAEHALYVSLIYEKNAVTLSEAVKYVLKPGWNDIFYTPDHEALAINYDLQACYGMALSFDRTGSRERENAPKLYLDDIRLKVSDTSVTTKSAITLEENEVCDFEQLYQKYVVKTKNHDKAFRPDLDIVVAEDYGVTATSGHRALRVVLKPVDCIDGTIYDGVYLTHAIIEAAGFGSLEDSDKLCFDVYNDSEAAIDFSITFHNIKTPGYKVRHMYTSPKQWTRFEISMENLDGLWEDAEKAFRKDPGEIHLEWPEFTGEERVIYLDNFHIEK